MSVAIEDLVRSECGLPVDTCLVAEGSVLDRFRSE